MPAAKATGWQPPRADRPSVVIENSRSACASDSRTSILEPLPVRQPQNVWEGFVSGTKQVAGSLLGAIGNSPKPVQGGLTSSPATQSTRRVDRLPQAQPAPSSSAKSKTSVAVVGLEYSGSIEDLLASGGALVDEERWEEAEQLLRELVRRTERVHGSSGEPTLEALGMFAGVLWRLGRVAQARRSLEVLVAVREQALVELGAAMPRVEPHSMRGRPAERVVERAAAEQALLDVLTELSVVLIESSQAAPAVPVLRRAHEMHRRRHGASSPQTAECAERLARALAAEGEVSEAVALVRGAVETRARVHGEISQEVADGANELAVLLQSAGELEAAEFEARRALHVYVALFGESHAYVATGLNNLALLLHAQGKLHGAEAVFRRVLRFYERAPSTDPDDCIAATVALVDVLWELRRVDEATSMLQHQLEAQAACPSVESLSLGQGYNALGSMHCEIGAHRAAARCFLRAASHLEVALAAAEGEQREAVALELSGSLSSHAVLLQDNGQPVDALPRLQRVAAVYEEVFGPWHSHTGIGQHNLGLALYEAGRAVPARAAVERSVRVLEHCFGSLHPDTHAAATGLATMVDEASVPARLFLDDLRERIRQDAAALLQANFRLLRRRRSRHQAAARDLPTSLAMPADPTSLITPPKRSGRSEGDSESTPVRPLPSLRRGASFSVVSQSAPAFPRPARTPSFASARTPSFARAATTRHWLAAERANTADGGASAVQRSATPPPAPQFAVPRKRSNHSSPTCNEQAFMPTADATAPSSPGLPSPAQPPLPSPPSVASPPLAPSPPPLQHNAQPPVASTILAAAPVAAPRPRRASRGNAFATAPLANVSDGGEGGPIASETTGLAAKGAPADDSARVAALDEATAPTEVRSRGLAAWPQWPKATRGGAGGGGGAGGPLALADRDLAEGSALMARGDVHKGEGLLRRSLYLYERLLLGAQHERWACAARALYEALLAAPSPRRLLEAELLLWRIFEAGAPSRDSLTDRRAAHAAHNERLHQLQMVQRNTAARWIQRKLRRSSRHAAAPETDELRPAADCPPGVTAARVDAASKPSRSPVMHALAVPARTDGYGGTAPSAMLVTDGSATDVAAQALPAEGGIARARWRRGFSLARTFKPGAATPLQWRPGVGERRATPLPGLQALPAISDVSRALSRYRQFEQRAFLDLELSLDTPAPSQLPPPPLNQPPLSDTTSSTSRGDGPLHAAPPVALEREQAWKRMRPVKAFDRLTRGLSRPMLLAFPSRRAAEDPPEPPPMPPAVPAAASRGECIYQSMRGQTGAETSWAGVCTCRACVVRSQQHWLEQSFGGGDESESDDDLDVDAPREEAVSGDVRPRSLSRLGKLVGRKTPDMAV